jgi:hypothetical protein
MRRRRQLLTVGLVSAALLAGCGGQSDDRASDDVAGSADPAEGWSESDRGAPPADEGIYLDASEAAGDGTATPTTPTGPGSEAVIDEPTAGSVDDNELWDEYLLYREEFLARGIPASDIDVAGRQILTVVDADGDPVLGADIVVRDESGDEVAALRTYADGRAVYLGSTDIDPDSQSRPTFTAEVRKGDVTAEVELTSAALEQTIALDADVPAPDQLDLLFLIDATGSMGDEIERLKASMISVAEQIAELPSSPDARFSMVVYRDRGDEYVTRTFDFTGDVVAFTDALAEVVADGGGDTPESLNAGFHSALTGPSWRDDDAVKLVFLVADAAPHLAGEPGYEDEPDYAADVRDAAARGIKVFPIASGGLDEQGEFVFRQLAQVTMGRFVFLTYGADGRSPGDSTVHDVDPDDYDVLALDDLVVRLVSDELAS